jgi:hypothetical protein
VILLAALLAFATPHPHAICASDPFLWTECHPWPQATNAASIMDAAKFCAEHHAGRFEGVILSPHENYVACSEADFRFDGKQWVRVRRWPH